MHHRNLAVRREHLPPLQFPRRHDPPRGVRCSTISHTTRKAESEPAADLRNGGQNSSNDKIYIAIE